MYAEMLTWCQRIRDKLKHIYILYQEETKYFFFQIVFY